MSRCPDTSPHIHPFVSVILSGTFTILPLEVDERGWGVLVGHRHRDSSACLSILHRPAAAGEEALFHSRLWRAGVLEKQLFFSINQKLREFAKHCLRLN